MKNPFLTTLRHLSEGTRLYGRDQPGQALGIFILSLYLPLMLPLLSLGVWTELESWAQQVRVPSPGLVLAAHAVVVAIIIALALTPPGAVNLAPRAPYPVERPVKTRIIVNTRLFIISMLGLSTIGIIFTAGLERMEHLVCLVIGGILLQLGHLDEVNAVQIDPVLERVHDSPLEHYDRWYARKWGQTPAHEEPSSHPKILRWHLLMVLTLAVLHLMALLGYIVAVHGPAGLAEHLPTAIFLAVTCGYLTIRAYEAHLQSVMIARHNSGSRFDSRFSHPETYVAAALIGTKLLSTAAMAALPLLWLAAQNRTTSALYLGILGVDLVVFIMLLFWSARRWLGRAGLSPRPLNRFERDYMRYLRRKHAAKQKAAIRGAIKYAKYRDLNQQLGAKPTEETLPN